MNKISASFRDPAGFVFTTKGTTYRQINFAGKQDYDLLMSSGLYDKLIEKQLLVSHNEINDLGIDDAYKIIKPEQIPFISHPFEWSFSQLKDAALTTLRILNIAINHNMILKDASAYNIQFVNNKAIFIDTLSFTSYTEGQPWIAYRQFCQHFLAPLALMSYTDFRLSKLITSYIDGLPLDLVSKLLPFKSKFNISINTHIHWHAKTQQKHHDETINREKKIHINKKGLKAIISNLFNTVNKLHWKLPNTEWGNYYNNTNYSDYSLNHKMDLVSQYLDKADVKTLWDLGANDGTFSRLALEKNINTIAFDIDPVAVEKHYQFNKKNETKNITPLILDLTNPSPSIGWANDERPNIDKRGNPDCVMALALIHHLAISNNLPFIEIASYFSRLGKYLIIEFVPKEDSKVQKLLSTREDIFTHYDINSFEEVFSQFYEVLIKSPIQQSNRTLYLMIRK